MKIIHNDALILSGFYSVKPTFGVILDSGFWISDSGPWGPQEPTPRRDLLYRYALSVFIKLAEYLTSKIWNPKSKIYVE